MNLNQITLSVSDLEASINFYKTLGLTMIVYAEGRYARLTCPQGDATLSLHTSEHLTVGGITVYFECNNLDAEVERLKTAGIRFEGPIQEQSWLWKEAALRDPDGHPIVLFYAGENRLYPPWRIK